MDKPPDEFLIPEWIFGEDIEKYIMKLNLAKEMDLFKDDKTLIFYSLTRSNRQDIITTLTEDQKAKLGDFTEFLREVFGPTIGEKRSIFENIRQNEEESVAEYFKRVELSYFRSKDIPIPSQMEEYQKEDIRHAFLKGLRSRETHRLLKLNPGTIDYTSLATTAANLEASLQDLERGNEQPVLKVVAEQDMMNRIRDLEEKLYALQRRHEDETN